MDQEYDSKIERLVDSMIAHPVIAAVRQPGQLALALASPVRMIFLLSGSINTLSGQCARIRESGRGCFLHVDLVEGLRPDSQGLRFVADVIRPDGIITTKPACVRQAQALGLFTVQRIFLLDSVALQDGKNHVQSARPDLVEVLPGLAGKAISQAVAAFDKPLIAGGLIQDREDVYAALAAGALAVSTSQAALWQL